MTRETPLGFQPPSIGEEEIEAVAETLRSGWLTTGPRAALLEERMAEYLEAKHVLAVASGTAALHLALVALGVGDGDEVITTPITWPATANVIVHSSATPVFVDVREGDLNIDPALVEAAVTERTKAIMPVHLAGQPCDLDPIWELGIPVIEDAAHAAESAYRGRKLGGLSEATCFSLYATKNIAAGEGGLVSTNSDEIAEAIRNLRLMRRGDGSLYDLTVPGYKANLSDVLAAIALVQLDKLPEHTAARERQFALYDEGLAAPSTGSSRSSATRATRTLCISTSFASTPSASASPATSCSRRSRPSESRPRSTSCPCTGSPGTASAFPSSRRSRSPSVRAARSSRCRSRRRTPTRTSRTCSRRSDESATAHEPAASRRARRCFSPASRSPISIWKIDLRQTIDSPAPTPTRGGSRSRSRS